MTATVVGPVVAPLGQPGGVSAAYDIAAATVIASGPALACQVAGSITLNDSATTGGAAITNQIIAVTMTAGQVIPLNFPCASGIVASSVTGGGVFSCSFN